MKKLFAAFMAAAIAACAPPVEARPAASTALTLMAITAYYEARGDGVHGMRAVCHVIKNRMKKSGGTVASVVLEPYQFSVWNRGGPARRKTPRANDPAFKEALEVARMVMAGEVRDAMHATHYHERSIRPAWTKKMRMVGIVGRHVYYKAR